MKHHLVSSPSDALAYITDCTLATIERMALHKRKPKHEWERQIAIAQHGLLWMAEYGVKVSEHDRAYDARNAGGVRKWAENLIANTPGERICEPSAGSKCAQLDGSAGGA